MLATFAEIQDIPMFFSTNARILKAPIFLPGL